MCGVSQIGSATMVLLFNEICLRVPFKWTFRSNVFCFLHKTRSFNNFHVTRSRSFLIWLFIVPCLCIEHETIKLKKCIIKTLFCDMRVAEKIDAKDQPNLGQILRLSRWFESLQKWLDILPVFLFFFPRYLINVYPKNIIFIRPNLRRE